MANSTKRSNPINDEANASSNSNANLSSNGRSYKRARYSFSNSTKYRQKIKISQPCYGFEDEHLKSGFRGSLHVDERFFSFGIQPGNIIEVKGAEKTGKTFLLTYFIARVLLMYPEKKVLFIDTRHKFNVKNFVSILCHFEKTITPTLGKTHEEREQKLSMPLPMLYEEYPQILSYLERVRVLQCYTPEEVMLHVGPPGESVVQKLLLQDTDVCLVAVDSIDNYSYSENLQSSSCAKLWPNVMHLLRTSVSSTRCPVICTSLIPADKHVYEIKRTKLNKQPSGSEGTKYNTPPPSNAPTANSPVVAGTNVSASVKTQSHQKEAVPEKFIRNFSVDYTVFTSILELTPLSKVTKAKLSRSCVRKITHCVEAYLRSRHNANTAGSGGNHRVRFSIFSDMLWII